MPKDKTFQFGDIPELVRHALELDYFHEVEGTVAIPAFWREGTGRLCLVVGENASGKSFTRRIFSAICKQAAEKTEYIPISMEGRRTIAYNPWLTFVYGDEETNATGVNSTETVLGGIRTSQGRDNRHVIFWDEPDLGLSDSWTMGLGQKLVGFIKEPPKHLVGAFIVTHSKVLVRELLHLDPHYLHLGVEPETAPKSLQEWVDAPIEARDIYTLSAQSHKRFKAIQRILSRVKP